MPNPIALPGASVVITGAARGIGYATARAFLARGARVFIGDLDGDLARTAAAELGCSGGQVDVRSRESLGEFLAGVEPPVQVLVNNAGIMPAGRFVDEPDAVTDAIVDVNLNGVFFGMRYQIPAMLKAGGGSIINIASILGQVGFVTASAYVTAKHGVVGLSRNAGIEYAQQGIRVNAVGPAFIRTPLLTNNLNEEQLEGIGAMHPIGRLGTPDEVAELVVWLAGDRSSFVTASYYAVDGGYLAK